MHIPSLSRIIKVIDNKFNVISYTVKYPNCHSWVIDRLISNGMSEDDLFAVSLQQGLFSICK